MEELGSRRQEQFVFSVILSCMAVAYLWDLSINGWSNAFYAAAVKPVARVGRRCFSAALIRRTTSQ